MASSDVCHVQIQWRGAHLSSSFSVSVRSVSEAIRSHVAKKLERAKGIPNAMVNKAAATAGELASPKHVTEALCEEICLRMPEELKKKGIFSRMEFVFHENRFAVLELHIVYVNPFALASAWSEVGVSCFLCCIGPSNRKYFEEEYRKFIYCGWTRRIGETLVLTCQFSLSLSLEMVE